VCSTQICDAGMQMKSLANRASAEGPLACQHSKGINTESEPS